jgi:outer membrane protein insertion porin family
LTAPTPNCNVLQTNRFFTPIGGDTQFVYNLEYRIPIVSVLSLAAFTDFGAVFNARRYSDQILTSNYLDPTPAAPEFINSTGNISGLLGPLGAAVTGEPSVFINNQTGTVLTTAQLDAVPKDQNGSPIGYTPAYIFGDTRSYQIADMQDPGGSFLTSLRQSLVSSMGLEFRVQMPVINVPFRLIWAYNPQARTDLTDPNTFGFIERKSVFRFSVGRTF